MSLKNPKTLRKSQENLGPQMTELQFLKKAVWSHLLKKSLIENFFFVSWKKH